ncbi:unnamed protein product [Pedinophyceae sp. YPF-701]|nr:unnamed protein product [Pedinophyceae sp. YPF-701]
MCLQALSSSSPRVVGLGRVPSRRAALPARQGPCRVVARAEPRYGHAANEIASISAKTSGKEAQQVVAPKRPLGLPSDTSGTVMVALVITQAVGLIGAFVGGRRANRFRKELQQVNSQLRQINAELRSRNEPELVPEADEAEAGIAYRNALENSMNSPSAAHPLEGVGKGNFSVAQARREISRSIKESYDDALEGDPEKGIKALDHAEELAIELKDAVAERAVVRAMAQCYREMAAASESEGKRQEAFRSAITCLERGLEISMQVGEYTGDADMYGDIGDLFVELGDLQKAGEYYDRCIKALSEDRITIPSSSWDC